MKINIFGKLLLALVMVSVYIASQAQDSITPLQRNAVLNTYIQSQENTSGLPKKRSKHGEPHTQNLPFFDDFSRGGLYPNDTLWLDNDVYINNTFGIKPPSTGFATFDGLNAEGNPYNPGDQGTGVATTDTLTSTYIDLSGFNDADSIYLSFYYQPTGLGDPQIASDSFILQFHPDSLFRNNKWDDSAWVTVWRVPGSDLHDFKQVIIPIRKLSSPNYFHNKFQFRFYAYGHRSGNLDQWHLDYIYVNRGRTRTRINDNDIDVAVQDVAVYKPSGSILNKYYSMPVKQFQAAITGGNNPLAGDIPIYARNNSTIVKNVTFGYNIVNRETGSVEATFFNTQGDNVNAFEHRRFELINKLTAASITAPKATLLVNTVVENIPDIFRRNDTATHKQVFDDYLAYDDGTAEGGYYLKGTNIGKAAVRFTLNTPDTLFGIAVHFNQANQYVGGKYVTLGMWHNLSPLGSAERDEFAARISFVKPEYEGINGFVYFEFAEPVPVNNEFYIGWIQNQDFPLNVGFDKNYTELLGPKSNNLFISTTGKWQLGNATGIPMMRPYIGRRPLTVGLEKESARKSDLNLNIYPNPNNGNFRVSVSERGNYEIMVFDIAGKPVNTAILTQESVDLNLQDIKAGIYLVKVTERSSGRSVVKRISVL